LYFVIIYSAHIAQNGALWALQVIYRYLQLTLQYNKSKVIENNWDTGILHTILGITKSSNRTTNCAIFPKTACFVVQFAYLCEKSTQQ